VIGWEDQADDWLLGNVYFITTCHLTDSLMNDSAVDGCVFVLTDL